MDVDTFPNLLIRASAGTGKTYQLTNRYIKLLHCGVLPEQILAVTFTRMAAGEILDRVMQRLARAALQESASQQLAEAIDEPGLNSNRCLDLIEQLTRQLHRLRVETLDSYFAQLARSFSLELGMPPGWSIIEQVRDDQLRTQSIQSLLRNDAYSLSSLLSLLFKGEADRSITQQLLDVVSDLYLLYRESEPGAWTRFPQVNTLNVAELRAAVLDLTQAELPEHKKIKAEHLEEVRLAEEKNWDAFVDRGNVKRVASGETTYYRKEYSPQTLEIYRRLIDHAKGILISELADQTRATHELLKLFDLEYVLEKDRERAYLFDDVTHRLSQFVGLQSMHLNSFRLDTRISHLLLDEFQDTSLEQWKVIQPLARHLTFPDEQQSFFFMGGRTSFFCVGDPKQAIYGWRGGRADIFDALPEQLGPLEETDLVTSFRSSPVVIETVNRVFRNLSNHKNLDRAKPAVKEFVENFPEHQTRREELAGYVEVVTSRHPGSDERADTANWKYAAERICQLHDRIARYSIGVLVRRNRAVAEIVGQLRQMGIPASEERGGNQLSDSAAVQLVLSLIKLADHPGDTISRYHLATSILGPELGLTDFQNDIQAKQLSLNIRQQLSSEGYGRTLSRITEGLLPQCQARQRRRLEQLVQLAYSYEENATLRPSNFVHFVESKRVPDPTNARVRVMTLHQAKGLEFDIVVLPDLDGMLMSQFKSCVHKRDAPTEPISHVSRRCRQEVRNILPQELLDLFDQATHDDVTGGLCLLYVALTRAIHALHVIVQPERPLSRTSSRLITKALAPEHPLEPETRVYVAGEENWFEKHSVSEQEPSQERIISLDRKIELAKPDQDDGGHWLMRSPTDSQARDYVPEASTVHGTPSVDPSVSCVRASNLLNMRNLESMARGTLIHRWLQEIEWLDQGLPSKSTFLGQSTSVPLGNLNLEDEYSNFEKMVLSPGLRSNLSRQYYQDPTTIGLPGDFEFDDLEVYREFPFVYRGESEFVSGTMDRLTLYRDQSRVVAADVIDFKTDVFDFADADRLSQKIASYMPQLLDYREAIEHMFALESRFVAIRLGFVNYDRVIRVDNGGALRENTSH